MAGKTNNNNYLVKKQMWKWQRRHTHSPPYFIFDLFLCVLALCAFWPSPPSFCRLHFPTEPSSFIRFYFIHSTLYLTSYLLIYGLWLSSSCSTARYFRGWYRRSDLMRSAGDKTTKSFGINNATTQIHSPSFATAIVYFSVLAHGFYQCGRTISQRSTHFGRRFFVLSHKLETHF